MSLKIKNNLFSIDKIRYTFNKYFAFPQAVIFKKHALNKSE